jgi:penicillin-binding protein 1C
MINSILKISVENLNSVGRWLRSNRKKTVRSGILLLTILAGLLIAGLWIFIHGQIVLKSWPATPLFEDRFGNYLAEASQEMNRKGFWSIDGPAPERISACIFAIEDRRFATHHGIDWRAIARALWHNLSGCGREGASTIAMQVARLQNPGKRTLWKKLCEMATARLLIARFGREKVLLHYLKIMPQGNQIFGVAYAARRYFQKPLVDLSWAEAAVLAALAKAPGRMNLFQPEGFQLAKKRAMVILCLLKKNRRLNDSTLAVQVDVLNSLSRPLPEKRPFHSYHAILRLYEELPKSEGGSWSKPLRTTLDMELQEYLDRLAGRAMNYYRHFGAGNMAIIVAEKNSGQVRGYLGSEFYFSAENAGAINFARTPRSTGSTLKPFIFALGLQDKKFTPASIIPDLPLTFTHASGDYSVTNFDESYLGPLLYRRALANSRNIPAVRVLKTVGLERVYDLFCRLGLADPRRKASYYGLNLAIGGLYVSLENLLQAYGVLANSGQAFKLNWFADETFGRRDAGQERFFSGDIAKLVTLFLADPLARLPSFARLSALEYKFPVAVKTGTSQGFRDAWAVAFSSRYLVGVWMGHPANEPMKNVNGQAAAAIAKNVLTWLQPEENRGVLEHPLPLPPGYETVRLCPLSGQLAGEFCPESLLEYFLPQDKPIEICTAHGRYAVDRRNGRLATAATPRTQIRFKT